MESADTQNDAARSRAGGAGAWLERPIFVLALMVLLSGIILHANWDKPFYNFDDETHVRVATEVPLRDLFFNFDTKYTYLPVSMASLRVDHWLFGPPMKPADPNKPAPDPTVREAMGGARAEDQPDEYYFNGKNWAPPVRVESGLYHALAGFLLWWLLRRLKAGPGVALAVAAAWTVHPMACESVCWISERKNVLAGMFGFAALLAQTARGRGWRWPLATGLYLLSTLSKPTGVGVFPIIVALEFLDPNAPPFRWRNARDWLHMAARLAGPAVVTLFIVWVNMNIHQQYFVAPPGGTHFTALLTDLEIFSRYIFNILVPVNLSFFYGLDPIRSVADPRVALFAVLLAGFCALMVWAAKKEMRPLALLGLIWFFGALGPNSNIATIPYWMQDRYAYISAAGLLLAVCLGVQGLFARVRRESWAPVLGVAFVGFIAILTFIRSPLFTDASLLVDDAAARQPRSGMAHYQSGLNHGNRLFYNHDPEYIRSGGQAKDARIALEESDRAMHCPDIDNFCSVYQLRLKCARIMLFMGAYANAREYLKGWLPPPNYQMSDPSRHYVAADMPTFYQPQWLAYAWIIMAEARWNMAMQLDRRVVPVADRIAETNAALAEVDKSLSIHVWEYQGYLLKARILIFLSWLDDEKKDIAASDKHNDAARRLLLQVPATSPLGGDAADLLTKIRK